MKYFDILPALAIARMEERGAQTGDLRYCVKADMDGENRYHDVYITFCGESLYVLCGYESYERMKKNKRRKELCGFDVTDYREIPLCDAEKLYVDRHQNTARLILAGKNGAETPLAQFSVGFSDKFEKFCERFNKTLAGEEIDDTLLAAAKTHCPVCGERFPDPNRPVCPQCVNRRAVIMRLATLFKEFKWQLTLILATILLANVFVIIAPMFSAKMLYDDVLTAGGKYYGQVLLVVIMMFSVSFGQFLFRIVSGIAIGVIVPKVVHRLRVKIFTSMQGLSLNFFTGKQTGSLLSRIDRDSNNIYWFFTDIVPYGITNIIKMVGISAIMLMLSPVLSLGVIVSIIFIHIVQHKFYTSQRKLYRKSDIATRSANSVLSDVMNGQRVVKSFAREEREIGRYSAKNNEAFSLNTRINKRVANTIPLIWTFCRVVNNLMFCVGAVLVINGHIALGTLTALVYYTEMTYEPINFFTWIGDRWAKCADAASRMFEIIDATPTVAQDEQPVKAGTLGGDIRFSDVSFSYEAGKPIIKNVSFDIKAGQMFGIVGKTGAGKSTIINLLARLYDVTGGEITIDGIPIRKLAFSDLRRSIGIVSQETYIFIGTVAENIAYACPDASVEEIIEAAKSANAHEFITKLPNGYNTRIGEGGIALSGGERQRISIARAIIQKPQILILDEATASMDTRTERKIQTAIDALKSGRTIISIAHRLSTLRDADMLCVIENGELKELGTHDELIRAKGKYFELYKLQSDALKFITE
ncbi:MAG: ABC transporter ATP-binding protein [Oscillospiraceae bacterium]